MSFRLSAALLLAALAAQAQNSSPVPPSLTAAEAEKLEAQLESNPEDPGSRARLLTYYYRLSATAAERARPLRRKHILWLIEHHPEDPSLAGTMAAIDPFGNALADPEGYKLADAAWRKHLPSADSKVYENAIAFFKTADSAFAWKLAAEGLERFPKDVRIAGVKGTLDALAILGGKQVDSMGSITVFDDALAQSETAKTARQELETTTNTNILSGAGMVLTRQNVALMTHRRQEQMGEAMALAERCYLRAIELEPANAAWKSGLRSVYQQTAASKTAPEDRIALLEKAARLGGNEIERLPVLQQLAESQFAIGALDLAAETASEVLEAAPRFPSNWNYGNAIHKGNIVLGRVALKRGDVAEAKRRLIAAGKTPGSPQLDSFGPDWQLARELAGRGEQTAVLEYIDLCRKFWKSDRGRLDDWAKSLAAGSIPNFNASAIRTPDMVGKPAPDFSLPSLKGGKVSLADYKGKVVLLDFWATWCAPCRQEMPHFEKLHREFLGKDVAVLAIDVGEPEATVADYINKEKLTLPVLLTQGTETAGHYAIEAYPTLVAVDRDGRVSSYLIGSRPEDALRDVLAKARAGAPPVSAPQLASPKLLSPEPAAVFEHFPRETTLVWSPIAGAAEYLVEVDYYSSGAWASEKRDRPAAFRVKQPVYSFRFYGAQPGRWRVWAVDGNGREGEKSEWREFRYTR